MLNTNTVNTMALIGWSIVVSFASERVTEVPSTVGTHYFSAYHTEGTIFMPDDRSGDFFEES